MSAAAPSAAAAPRTSSVPRSFPSTLLPAKGPNRVVSPQRAAVNPVAPAKRSSPKKIKTKVPIPSPRDGDRAVLTPTRVPPKTVPQPRPTPPSPITTVPIPVSTPNKGPPQPSATALPTPPIQFPPPTVSAVKKGPPRVSPQVLRTASTSSTSGPIRRPSIPRSRPHPHGSSLGGGSDTDTSTSEMPIPLPDNTRRAGGSSGPRATNTGGTSSSSIPPSPIRARRIISSRNTTTEDDSPKQPRSANSSICFVLESNTKFVESAPTSRRPSPSSSRQSPPLRPRDAGSEMPVLEPSPIKALNFEEGSQANILPQVEEKSSNTPPPPPLLPPLLAPSGAVVAAMSSSSSSSSIGEVIFRKRDRNNAKRSVSSTTDEDRDPQRRRRVGGRAAEVAVGSLRTLSGLVAAAEDDAVAVVSEAPPANDTNRNVPKDGRIPSTEDRVSMRVVEDPFGDGELYREHGITYTPPEANPPIYKSAPPSSVANTSFRNADVESDDSVLWAKKYVPVPAPTAAAIPTPSPPPPPVVDDMSHLKRLLESATGDTSGLNHSMDDDRSASVASSMVFEPIPKPLPLPRPPTVPPTHANHSSQKLTSVVSVAVQATPPRPSRIETEDLVTTSPYVAKDVLVVPKGSVVVREVGTVTVEKGLAMHLGPATRRPDPKGYAFLQKLRDDPSHLKPRPSSSSYGVRSGVRRPTSSSTSQASRRRGWDDSKPEVVPWEKQLRNAVQDEEDEKLRRRRDPSGVVMHGCCVGERHQLFGPIGKALVAKLDELPAIVESHTPPPAHRHHDDVPRFEPPPPPHPARVSRSPPKTVERASFQQHHPLLCYSDHDNRHPPEMEQPAPSLVCRGLGLSDWGESDADRTRDLPMASASPSARSRNAAQTPSEFLVAWRATRQAALLALQEVQLPAAAVGAPTSVRSHNEVPILPHPIPTTTSLHYPHANQVPTVLDGCGDGLCSTPPSEPQEPNQTVSPTPPQPAPYSYGTDNTIDGGLESFVLRGSASPPPSQQPHHNQMVVSQPHAVATSPLQTSGSAQGGVLARTCDSNPPPTHSGENKEALLLTLLQQSMSLQAEQLRLQQERFERHQAREEKRKIERERRKSTTPSQYPGSVRACSSKEYEALKAYTAKIKELEIENIHLKHKVAAKDDERAIQQGTYDPTAAIITTAAETP